jgi:hypothetical protein
MYFYCLCLCILIVRLCMATLTEVYPCFSLSCTANARVKPAKTGHGPHSSQFLHCSMYFLFCVVSCIVCVYMRTVLLPPGGYPTAIKYIISYHINKQALHSKCTNGCEREIHCPQSLVSDNRRHIRLSFMFRSLTPEIYSVLLDFTPVVFQYTGTVTPSN